MSDALKARFPTLSTLCISGYTDNVIGPNGVLDLNEHFLQKPFSRAQLLTAIRHILDGRAPGHCAADEG